ncbi:MAG TPA: hypothetical protein VLX90_21805 [Steroidobacteraceae bacterium]|nr:hypothetical protein [Steroidobacteraceae bacterium]
MEIILLSGLGAASLLLTELGGLVRGYWSDGSRDARPVASALAQAARRVADTVTLQVMPAATQRCG